jgi:flagellar L-ring protein precursor FlgH
MKWAARSASAAIALSLAATLAGCANDGDKFMSEPSMSPVGAGLIAPIHGPTDPTATSSIRSAHPAFDPTAANLYQDQRITKVGDIVRVIIAINDKAALGNSTDRSQTASSDVNLDWSLNTSGSSSGSPSTISGGITSNDSTQGQGNIDRTEQIQVSVAAVVTQVLPNGNLFISGSQEVRVNYELRQLTVAGIIRPWDISPDNSISYDRIAEARISYGGRGRLNDVQQPSWGQQLYDKVKPY